MQRYFVNNCSNNIFTLSKDETYHLTKVMRVAINDLVEIVYDNNLYLSKIIQLEPLIRCEIVEKIITKDKNIPKVTLVQSIVKDNKLEYILQKSTELGVEEIIIYKSTRSIVKINENDKKLDRWNKIIREASEQSKRISVPILDKIVDLKELVKLEYDYKFLSTVNNNTNFIKQELHNIDINATILFVVGPEGGFTDEEEKYMIDNGFKPISLGDNVLRTETASLFILSAINYEFMR